MHQSTLKLLTSNFQGQMRMVGDQLQNLFVNSVFHREAVYSDDLVPDLQENTRLLLMHNIQWFTLVNMDTYIKVNVKINSTYNRLLLQFSVLLLINII